MKILNFVKPRGIIETKRTDWEKQYEKGFWDYLAEPEQYPRYILIGGFISQSFKKNGSGSVLDVGCGEGLLRNCIANCGLYVGLDYSFSAIRKAQRRSNRSLFIVQDALTFSPKRKFDFIVMNECLYYFPSPVQVFERFSDFLRPEGIAITSLFTSRGDIRELNARLSKKFGRKKISDFRIENVDGDGEFKEWTITFFRS